MVRALLGALLTGGLAGCPPPQVGAPSPSTVDANQAWSDFWAAIGDGFVPELPLADLPRADRAAETLARVEPSGFRGDMAAAELAVLRGAHLKAQAAVARAAVRCGTEPSCLAATTVLASFVVTDQFSSFDRIVYVDAVRSKGQDVDIEKIDIDARAALPKVAAPLQRASRAWYAASRVRWIRAGFQAVHYLTTPEDEAQLDAAADQQFNPIGVDPVVRVLRWSIHPSDRLPESEGGLGAAAALLRADRLLAPNGGASGLDVHVVGGAPDRATWFAEGLQSPLEQRPTDEDYAAARKLIAGAVADSSGSMLASHRAYLTAYLDVAEGRANDARAHLDEARVGFKALGAPIAEVPAMLLAAALDVQQGNASATFDAFRGALDRTEGGGSTGRSAAVLGVAASTAERIFHLGQRYRVGADLAILAADLAAKHGYFDQALRLANTSVDLVQSLSLPQEVARLAPQSSRVCEDVVRGYETYGAARKLEGQHREAMVTLPIESVRGVQASLAYSEASALAMLGARQSLVNKRLDAFATLAAAGKLTGPGTSTDAFVASSRLSVEIAQFTAQGDLEGAIELAKQRGLTDLAELIAARQGSAIDLASSERAIRSAEADLQAVAQGPGSKIQRYLQLMLRLQALAAKRESYVAACERLGKAHGARRVFEAWRADPFSGEIATTLPFRPMILEAQVLAAEGKPAEAAAKYEQAIALLRARAASGDHRDRHQSTASAISEAYGGRARMALLAKDPLMALDRIDELRWLTEQQDVPGHAPGAPPALDLGRVKAALGDDATVLIVTDLGIPGSVQGFLWSPRKGLRARAFANSADGMGLGRALDLVYAGEAPTGPAAELASWLATEAPREHALILSVSSRLRAAGLHVLPVGGEALALRNPFFYAPSLRTLAALLERKPGKGDRVVVGTPVTADTSREVLGELTPLASETELRGLPADRFFWNKDATVATTTAAVAGARRVHFSSHGRVDELDATRTGMVLAGGEILSPLAASRLELAAPLVILSACQSLQIHPFASGVPALDRAFLIAGARAVISTPLAVNADVAAAWMQALHEGLDQGLPVMNAARHAYVRTRVAFPDAKKWGAFSVVGAGEGPA